MNNDCIYCIFTKLPVKDIISCSQVSKQFNTISKIDIIWQPYLKENFITLCVQKTFTQITKHTLF